MSLNNSSEEKTLYWNIGSQPGRAVKALIDIGKIQCKLVSIDLMSRQQKSKQYLSKYPLGKIPFFTKGNLSIGQSNAIMVYLWQTQQSIPRSYYGANPSDRALVNQYMSWYQSFFRPKMFKPVMLFLSSFLLGKPIYQNQKEQSIGQVHEALKALDQLIRIEWKNNPNAKFICGTEHPTLADILVFFQTTNCVYFGIDQAKYEYLQKWFKNTYKIPQIQTITHQWYSIGKQFAQMFSQVQVIKSKL